MAITFVNNSSSSSNAFTSVCARFAWDLENTSYGNAYRLMNNGYRELSRIAWYVYSKEGAFTLIGHAYGSADIFFQLLEEQQHL